MVNPPGSSTVPVWLTRAPLIDGGSLTVKADREELPALLGDPRVKPAPYLARGGWIRLDLSTGKVDWTEIDELIRTSYCLIAPKKLSALLL